MLRNDYSQFFIGKTDMHQKAGVHQKTADARIKCVLCAAKIVKSPCV